MEGLDLSGADRAGDAARLGDAERRFWRDRPTLVTGATGLLGGWLVRRLVAAGADVVCLVRDSVPRSTLYADGLSDRVRVVRGDVCDQPLLERALGEYEVCTVMHLAAQAIVQVANRNPVATFEANVRGTWSLLEAVRRSPAVKQVVVASSDKAYGDQPKLPYDEETPLQGLHPYDVSKSCADLIAQTYAHTYRVPVGITRCGNFYGGGDLNWNRIVPGTVRSALRGERPVIRSDGLFVRDYFYVEDGAACYMRLAEALAANPDLRGQAFNFSNEIQVTVLDLVRKLLGLLGSPLEPEVRNEAANEIRHQYLSAAKARRELGLAAPVHAGPRVDPHHRLVQGLSSGDRVMTADELEAHRPGRCHGCGRPGLETFLSLGRTPLANSLLSADQLSAPEPTFPLEVGLCPACALVQLTETVPPERMFSEYLYFSSFSDTMVRHAADVVEELVRDRCLGTSSLAVEIASNDGYLLQHFVRAGVPVLGVEPAQNVAKVARERGVETVAEFFGRDLAARLAAEGRRTDVVLANNVMAHVPDVHGVLAGVEVLLKPGGVFVMETPYVKDLLDHLEFDTVYHEHVFYYSLTALQSLYARHGLTAIDVRPPADPRRVRCTSSSPGTPTASGCQRG